MWFLIRSSKIRRAFDAATAVTAMETSSHDRCHLARWCSFDAATAVTAMETRNAREQALGELRPLMQPRR